MDIRKLFYTGKPVQLVKLARKLTFSDEWFLVSNTNIEKFIEKEKEQEQGSQDLPEKQDPQGG